MKTKTGDDRETTLAVRTGELRTETLADQVLSITAMAGAAVGAVGGAVLGAEANTAFPLACGTAGTMLGSALAAGGWCLLRGLWMALFTHHERANKNTDATPQVVTLGLGAE